MSILSLSQYQSALKQDVLFQKQSIAINGGWMSGWIAGTQPPAGSYAIGNTANGLVPTDATTGAPTILFSSGRGYLTKASVNNGLIGEFHRVMLCDRLFHAGTYSFNSNVTLSAQPSFSSRVPGGTDFTGLRLWIETVTQMTGGTPAVTVTYTDQSGNTGHTTGTFSYGAGNIAKTGCMFEMPLAAGDSGLQKIESVVATTATAGTFNLVVTRTLWHGRNHSRGSGEIRGSVEVYNTPDLVGMPELFGNSCLFLMMLPQVGSGSESINADFEIASA